DHGIECPIWVPGGGSALSRAQQLNLTISQYKATWAFSTSKTKAGFENWRIGRALRRSRGSVVHVHGPGHYGALRWGLRYAAMKTVAHVHIEETPELLQWALRTPPNLIITCARFLVDYVRQALPAPH